MVQISGISVEGVQIEGLNRIDGECRTSYRERNPSRYELAISHHNRYRSVPHMYVVVQQNTPKKSVGGQTTTDGLDLAMNELLVQEQSDKHRRS